MIVAQAPEHSLLIHYWTEWHLFHSFDGSWLFLWTRCPVVTFIWYAFYNNILMGVLAFLKWADVLSGYYRHIFSYPSTVLWCIPVSLIVMLFTLHSTLHMLWHMLWSFESYKTFLCSECQRQNYETLKLIKSNSGYIILELKMTLMLKSKAPELTNKHQICFHWWFS